MAVAAVIVGEQLEAMQAACTALIAERVAATPQGVTWNRPGMSLAAPDELEHRVREPGRYSFGSHGNLHRKEWAMLADLPRLSPILSAIFQSEDYLCWGAGGDFCLPGTIEYQHLHRDTGPGNFMDPAGRVQIWDLPPCEVTCNFPMVDFDCLNGPMCALLYARSARTYKFAHLLNVCRSRQIPGTQSSREQPPPVASEPEWMKLSTVAPLAAGGVIIRDLRAWHGTRGLIPTNPY